MSDKMTCPGCDSRTSSVLRAFEEGHPCPSCGLSADAAGEILRIQRARADEGLKRELAEAVKARAVAERKARSAEYKLGELRRQVAEILDAQDPEWLHDGFHG